MRSITMIGFAAVAAALSVVGCNDSDDSVPMESAGASNAGAPSTAGASGGGNTEQECVATYEGLTSTEFLATTTADKACSSESDATTACTDDMPTVAGACGRACLGMGNDAQQATCVAGCITDKLAEDDKALSDSCIGCYTANVECARKNCLVDCGLNPTGEACTKCRADNGCASAFYDCSGLPEPR